MIDSQAHIAPAKGRSRHDGFAATLGMSIVIVFLLLAILGWSGIAGQDWASASGKPWEPASAEHWFGTNRLGQDVFDRAMQGAAVAFETGVLVALLSTALGAVLGGLAGWFSHGLIDELILWLKGVLDSIPFYLFVAALAFAMRDNPWAMHVAMILTFWTATARLVRGEVMRLRRQEFVESARAIGLGHAKILFRHVLPNTRHLLLIQGSLTFIAAIKTEVILSFLGLGIRDGVSWGLMLAESTQEVLSGRFANFAAASGMLFALLLGLNLLTDAYEDSGSEEVRA